MRLRIVSRAPEIALNGVDAFDCCTLGRGTELRVGQRGNCHWVIRRTGGISALGGGISYVFKRNAAGECRVWHTGHIGRISLDGVDATERAASVDGLVLPNPARLDFSLDGRAVLELSYESSDAAIGVAPALLAAPSPLHRWLEARAHAFAHGLRAPFSVALGARQPAGFGSRLFDALGPAPDVTRETKIYDGVTGLQLSLDALSPGDVGRVALVVGRRVDGTFGRVARELRVFFPEARQIDIARRGRGLLRQFGVELAFDDRTLAARHLQACTEHAATPPLEQELLASLFVERDALALHTLGEPHAILQAVLAVHERGGLPRLFDAERALAEARSSGELFQYLIDELNLSLATARSALRFGPLYFADDAAPIHVSFSEEERAAVLDSGLLFARPQLTGSVPDVEFGH